MRVLQIIDNMNRGGAQAFIMNIYRKIDREILQFDFLLHTKEECAFNDEIRSLGGKIYTVPPRNQGILKNKKALNDFFKEHSDYKVIHHHVSSLTYVTPLKIASNYNVPHRIVHSHNTKQGGSYVHNFIHRYNQMFVKNFATDYFACSQEAAKWLFGETLSDNYDSSVVRNGIDVSKFKYDKTLRDNIRSELKIGNKIALGHIGRFMHQKNHEFLIDIFYEFHKINSNSVLILVGEGELKNKIEEKVVIKGLKDNVLFLGSRSNVNELLQAFDLFVMPSFHEGLPVTLVEAQAASLPCVISDGITHEVDLLNHIKYVSLRESAKNWAQSCLQVISNNFRKDESLLITNSGFDSSSVAQMLSEKYLNYR
ncbi:glycosyl transferase family 1 [Bacillus sp. AFS077874]|uniref:glycosyltransferase family 1 protein n=1 Tax=Bacillus sp. AFS077874 TaxID=2033513 RepID=UPI000BF71AAC|nr:glycosyltransferase family 1 protein [Bacillus sp. AFS077874]PFM78975.1 glycosyl transferase family 1 [Bacillus sp. AFS077874]